MNEIIISYLWIVILTIAVLVNHNSVSGCCCCCKKKNKGSKGNAKGQKDAKAPEIKAPAQAGIAGTFDPNYQTMAGLGNDVFGAEKGGAGGGGAVAVKQPAAPAQGGMAETYDPNYQTMAGLGNDVFGDKGAGGGGGGVAQAGGGVAQAGGGAGGVAPQAPQQGGMAGTYDPNYQTLAGMGNDVFDKK